jgi:hypothetical protein
MYSDEWYCKKSEMDEFGVESDLGLIGGFRYASKASQVNTDASTSYDPYGIGDTGV